MSDKKKVILSDEHDGVSAKKVYEELGTKILLSDEIKVLRINGTFYLPEERSDNFRYMARILSKHCNMPFGVWSNSGGGFHSGFFFHSIYDYETLDEYLDEFNKRREMIIASDFVELLKEVDPGKKYEFYHYF